jgi:hypothetical protein
VVDRRQRGAESPIAPFDLESPNDLVTQRGEGREMIKRAMLMAGLALAAIAFTAPAAAAEIYLSDDTGALEVGAKVRTTSSDFVTTRPDGTKLECAVVKLHLELVDAGPQHLELKQLEPATTFNCELNREPISMEKLSATVEDGTIGVGEGNILTINTWGTGSTNVSFLTKIFADFNHQMLLAECPFAGKVHVEATFETSDQLTITPAAVEGPCGKGTLEGELTLETPEDGHEIQIHYEETS